MTVAFLGSGPLGLPTLNALHASDEVDLVGVVTQPDRPGGRGLKLKSTPIRQRAGVLGLPVLQPHRANEAVDELRALDADVYVVAAYGQILSREVLDIPHVAPINLHASLLPKYRGAAPVHWALIRGETDTGVTTFIMEEGLDSGPILVQRTLEIDDRDTAGTLEGRLAEIGADAVLETVRGLRDGTLEPRPQDSDEATLAPKIQKAQGEIDWTQDAVAIANLIRGLNPWPGAYTHWRGDRLKVHFARSASPEAANGRGGEPGEVIGVGPDGPCVQTGQGLLELIEVQPAGKKPMQGLDLVNGYRLEIGEQLGRAQR